MKRLLIFSLILSLSAPTFSVFAVETKTAKNSTEISEAEASGRPFLSIPGVVSTFGNWPDGDNCYRNGATTTETVPESDLLSCNIFTSSSIKLTFLNNYRGEALDFFVQDPIYSDLNVRLIGDNQIITSGNFGLRSNLERSSIQGYNYLIPEEYIDPTATLSISVNPTAADFVTPDITSSTSAPSGIISTYGDFVLGTDLTLNISINPTYGVQHNIFNSSPVTTNPAPIGIVVPQNRTLFQSVVASVNIDNPSGDYAISAGHYSTLIEDNFPIDPNLDTNLQATIKTSGDIFQNNDFNFLFIEDQPDGDRVVNLSPYYHTFAAYDNHDGTITYILKRVIRGVLAQFSEPLYAGESLESAEARLQNSLSIPRDSWTDCYRDLAGTTGTFQSDREIATLDYKFCASLEKDSESSSSETENSYSFFNFFTSLAYDIDPANSHLLNLTDPDSLTIQTDHTYAFLVAFKTTNDRFAFSSANISEISEAVINDKYFFVNSERRQLAFRTHPADGQTETFLYPLTTILPPEEAPIEPIELTEPENFVPKTPEENLLVPENSNRQIIIPKTPNTGTRK